MNVLISDPTYRIEAELGSGGGGVVYKAYHERLQKYVVIKELKRGAANTLATQRNEVEALKNVKSEYLPQVYDFLQEDDRVFTVIEFIDGESLDKAIEHGVKFKQADVIKWYGQLSSALAILHKQNVCHRDIKPANIMLTLSGDVCLVDFNAALVDGNDVQLISRSLGYASPEQYEIYERYKKTAGAASAAMRLGGSSVVTNANTAEKTELISDDRTELLPDESDKTELVSDDKTELILPSDMDKIDWVKSDIYSLGATMYHLLSGIHPPILAKEVIPLSKLNKYSEGIAYIIDKSMSISPAERFATASALVSTVKNIRKFDRRFRAAERKKIAAAILFPLLFGGFALTSLYGLQTLEQEKEIHYYELTEQMATVENFTDNFNEAITLYPNRIDAYYANAERLWNDGDNHQVKTFIEDNLGLIVSFPDDDNIELGNIYHLLGSCYFEEEDYINAANYLSESEKYIQNNAEIYRDFAISAARIGQISAAENALTIAEDLGLSNDSLSLLKGEINYAKKDYEAALTNLSDVVNTTADDYIRYRAYHLSDEIYKTIGDYENSVLILEECLNRIPENRVNEMTERLADTYMKLGRDTEAIECFKKLLDTGVKTFALQQNLAILYMNTGDFANAKIVLTGMLTDYPENYRVPMRLAFLEADKQSDFANEDRNYTAAYEYYKVAIDLYAESLKAGDSDPEMDILKRVIEDIRAQGWLE
jgi:serine/threonine-protein kinase